MSKRSYTHFYGENNLQVTTLRHISAFALAAIFVASIMLAGPAAADPAPVRLKLAYSMNYTPGSSVHVSYTIIQVKVKNLAYTKKVTMHYRNSDDTWKDQPLPFIGHYGNYDVFGSDITPVTSELAIRYNASNEEYWDNNNETNYHIDTSQGAVGGNIMLNEAKAVVYGEPAAGQVVPLSYFQGQIYVQNLSYHKIVGVHWSRDGGKNWTDTNAFYGGKVTAPVIGEIPTVEIWNFNTPSMETTDSPFQFAVFYKQRNDDNTTTVATYWDNNFTQNYVLPQLNGATIR